ncbi:MAG: hypothetical protein HY286_13475 [Planctomycetes bacterium]|nr:hypothetical protein [Planctomycetota bacterium]
MSQFTSYCRAEIWHNANLMSSITKLRFLTSSFAIAALIGVAVAQNPTESRPAASQPAIPKDPAKAKAALAKAQESNRKRDITADLEMNINAMGFEIKGTGKQMTSKDGKMRMELDMELPMGQGHMKQTVVNDGKNIWNIQESPMLPQPMIMKSTVEEAKEMGKKMGGGMMGGGSTGDTESTITDLQKQFDFDTIEESIKIGDHEFWAVTGEIKKDSLPKSGPQAQIMGAMKRTRIIFDKKTDIFSGMEMLTGTGQKIMSMVYKNINIEPKFKEDQFVYTPPKDAKVSSMAELMRSMGGGGGDEDDGDDEADEPAKKVEAPASKPAGGVKSDIK